MRCWICPVAASIGSEIHSRPKPVGPDHPPHEPSVRGLGAAVGGVLYGVFGELVGRAFFKATFGVYLPGHYGVSLMDNMLVSYALSPGVVVVLVIATALTGGLGSLYALYKAYRLSPVEALRA